MKTQTTNPAHGRSAYTRAINEGDKSWTSDPFMRPQAHKWTCDVRDHGQECDPYYAMCGSMDRK